MISQNSPSYSPSVSCFLSWTLQLVSTLLVEETLVGNSGRGATRALVVAMVRGVFGCEPKDRDSSVGQLNGGWGNLPSLKLTSKAPENGWLEDFLVSFCSPAITTD